MLRLSFAAVRNGPPHDVLATIPSAHRIRQRFGPAVLVTLQSRLSPGRQSVFYLI